ncbi:iron complex transport system permease protein [Streptosporangium becharense]|uniref:Iron complex transport system permease protein n=1 Tax=Streptosporangium becharense TaxID=1816182 RepID=A0A7W9IBZ3_9ACTN|nr:iron ABC transporter permease [Streptosporangium becharense]MBB2910751.1 iron complex transport system permease protein [Streptosporangium becharense]MBB5817446.1 iron complex transport system permease protein [Streptosporangium becharense]
MPLTTAAPAATGDGAVSPRARRTPALAALAGVLAVLVTAGLCLGTPLIAPHRLPAVLGDPASLEYVVLWELRLPRLLIGLLGGAAVGVAGLMLQESLRNPLAVPELLGVSAGAALAVAACVVWALPVPFALHPLVGLAGAVLGGAVTLAVARTARSAQGVLLVGAAVSTAVQALMLAVLATADRLQYDLLFRYLVGSLSGLMWEQAGHALPWFAVAVPLVLACVPALGLLRLGDEAAAALGGRVTAARLGVLAVAALLVGSVVGPCGPVSWVGLIAPLLARRLRPSGDARVWLPWSAALGASVTAAADLAARLALAPVETPLGAWTAFAGVLAGALLFRGGRTA